MKINKSNSKTVYVSFRLDKEEFEVEVTNGFICGGFRRGGNKETDLLVFIQELAKLGNRELRGIIKSLVKAQKDTKR